MDPTLAARSPRPGNHWRSVLLLMGLLFALTASPAYAWFWQTPDWSSINAGLDEDYPEIAHISTRDLERRLADDTSPAPLLIDARGPDEFEVSHIPGAVHAETVEQVQALLRKRPTGTETIVYCSVGVRSARLVAKLQAAGLNNAVNLKGSIFEWANRRLPVYRGDKPVVGVHPFNAKWGELLDREHWSHEP